MKLKNFALCLFILIIMILVAGAVKITRNVSAYVPDGFLVHDPNGIISFREYDIKARDASYMTAFSMTKVTVAADGVNTTANLVMTDEKYKELSKIRMVNGTWFSFSSLDRENNNVVIGSDLASKLFFTLDVVGKELKINNRYFTVSGVYEPADGFIYDLSSDGVPVVYCAYTNEAEESKVEYLLLQKDDDNRIYQNDVKLMLYDVFGKEINFTGSNLSDKALLIKFYPYVFLRLLIAFTLVVCILRIASSISKMLYIRKESSVKSFIVLLAGIVFFVLLVICLCRLPRIPESILPTENIFNVSHYISRYTEEAQGINRNTSSIFDRQLFISFTILTIQYSLILILLIGIYFLIRRKIRTKSTETRDHKE